MRRYTKRRRGFTLMEVLLVILIISMLAGLAIFAFSGTREGARKDIARNLVEQVIPNALQTYNMHVGHYPKEDEGGLKALQTKPSFSDETLNDKWRGPYLTQDPKDPWGHDVHYEEVAPGTGDNTVGFRVWSDGPDGSPGTEDDITYPKPVTPGQ